MYYPLFFSNYNSSYPGSRERLMCVNSKHLKDAMGTATQAHSDASRTSSNLLKMLSQKIFEKGKSAELVVHSYTAASWRREGFHIPTSFTVVTASGSSPTQPKSCSAQEETCVVKR